MQYLYIVMFFVVLAQSAFGQQYYSDNSDYGSTIGVNRPENEGNKGKLSMGFNYNIAKPKGDFENYISANSLTGASIDLTYFATENLSLGVMAGYQYFTEKQEDVVTYGDDGFWKGTQFRNVFAVPVLAKADYHFINKSSFSAYVGSGAGVALIRKEIEVSKYISVESGAKFMLKPEMGVMLKIYENIFINIGVDYNHIFNAGSEGDLGYMGAAVGLVIR